MRLDQIKQIVGSTAVYAPPASAEELKQCQDDLYILNLPPIPEEYTGFLCKYNGFLDGGDQEFFGTEKIKLSNYKLKDIVTANQNDIDFYVREKKLLIGRGGEELFVYNSVNGCYEIIDDTALDVYHSFNTFEDMFRAVNKRR